MAEDNVLHLHAITAPWILPPMTTNTHRTVSKRTMRTSRTVNLQDSFRSWRKWIRTYPIVLQNLQLCGHFSVPGICYCNQSFFQPKLAWTTARSVSNLMMSTNNMLRTSTVQRKESKNVEDCSRQPRGGKDEIQRRVSGYTYEQRGEGLPEFR